MTVKKCKKDKQIAKLLRRVEHLEAKNEQTAAKLKDANKTIKKLKRQEEKNKKKETTIRLTREQRQLMSDISEGMSTPNS